MRLCILIMNAILITLPYVSQSILNAQEEMDVSNSGTELNLEDLMNMKVSVASKSEENIGEAPGVISVVTQDELRRFGGTTLADILKRVPSFLGSTVYMTDRSIIAARGDQIMPSSSHVLLLINGRPIREIHEGGIKSEVYESFPVSVIERIEVIRGPGSVLYGSQAFSAVINVITKKPENNTISISGMLGEGMKNNIVADMQYKLGDFGIVVSGRYADKGGWNTQWIAPGLPGIEHTIDVTIPDNGPGVYAEASWKELRLMYSYNQWDNRNFIPVNEFLHDLPSGVPGHIDGHTTGRIRWQKHFTDLGYKHTVNEWYNVSLNITFTQSLFKAFGWPFTSRNSYEGLAEFTNFFTPLKNLNILVGGVYGRLTGLEKNINNDTLDFNRGIFNEGHIGNSISGYTQIDYRWNWCKIIGGLQANKVFFKDTTGKVDNFDLDFNPRAGLILHPLEHIDIKALYSTAYRAPSENELYMDYIIISGKMTPQNDPHFDLWNHEYYLKPEKVHTFDLGVNYADDKAQFGLNGFYSSMRNIIIQDLDTSHYSHATWDNTDDVVIFGLECEGKYYLTQSIFFQGSFLYQQSRNENTRENNVTPLPNFSVKGGLSYQSKFGLTISAFNTFQESVDPKYYDQRNPSTKYFNMANVYCSYDLNKLMKAIAIKQISLVLNIDNLLDEEVWLPNWGQPVGFSIPYIEGRTIYGGFKVSF